MIEHLRTALLRLARDEGGSPAIEFGLVAPLFFGFIFSFYDMGLVMLRQVMLHSSVDKIVRDLRIEPEEVTKDEFVDEVCRRAIVFRNCQRDLVVELTPVPEGTPFPTTTAQCADSSQTVRPTTSYDPSHPATLMLLRVCMIVKPMIPGMGVALGMQKDSGGAVSIIATSAYMSE